MQTAMTAPSSLLNLDDPAALAAADTDGALRSAALAGAQVRATSAAVEESVAERLGDLRPRSVVFVAGEGRAGRAASMLIAAIGARIGFPLVHAATTPLWVGPLDVVVVSGDDAGDPRLAESTSAAVRRGAETVLVTPDEGPLRSAAAGRAVFLPPRVAVREHNTLMRYLAAGTAVLAAVSDGAYRSLLPDLSEVADLLDAEAARNHPSHEVFHNPAKSLAAQISGSRVVLSGAGAVDVELARHGSEVLLRAAGVVAGASELSDVIAAVASSGRPSGAAPVEYDAFFHDEEFDGPRPEQAIRVVVLASDSLAALAERRTAALPDSIVITAGLPEFDRGRIDFGSVSESVDGAGGYRREGRDGAGNTSHAAGELGATAVLATRLEMAAAYLHLMGGK